MSYRPFATASNAAALRIADLTDKLEGYPSRGEHFGGGRHADVPVAWDGVPPVPPGWSSYRAAVVGSEYRGAGGRAWLRVNGAAPTLTPAERTELITLLTPARRFSTRWPARFW